ncbi:uncharacterized protein EV422DRAFT_6208 [Fimicolochytrium jonesii]|uniref:uncharacterized protein n=1 Tax=Fimicolochytrium jonesii TaxID=1396493 RepID=UPI0022FF28B3|nr:uncharacterized protein EV422DRAFT_6208 [Fimicolochytrium jonesii]KAI8826682.1 hypothetical protein EV422DRAFT_6208 [Fimicolochytrium jonesii]
MAYKIISQKDEDILNVIFNPGANPLSDGNETQQGQPAPRSFSPTLLTQLKKLEAEAVQLAEEKDVKGAIQKLDECIRLEPGYASAYNNRAQAYRLEGDVDKALADLAKAIELGEGDPVVLKQAYTQRAVIRKDKGDVNGSDSDFAQGARYGNEVAKAAVKNNPYAKMCNQVVMEAMSKLNQKA